MQPSAKGCRFVVAIDFGTTFSGVAFASINPALSAADYLSSDSALAINVIHDWAQDVEEEEEGEQGGGVRRAPPFQKTRTCLVLEKRLTRTPKLWGTDAFNKFVLPSLYRAQLGNCVFVELFKPVLCSGDRIDEFDREYGFLINRGKKAVVKAIGLFLSSLKTRVMEHLSRLPNSGVITPGVIKWVVTVPAQWGNSERSMMRAACMEARLFTSLAECTKDRFQLVCEPVAAAIRVLQQKGEIQNLAMQKNLHFMVCDAGGGTIDVSCVETKFDGAMKMKLVTTPSGSDTGGSSAVDDEFQKWVFTIVGAQVQALLESAENRQYLRKLVHNFETEKILFDNESQVIPVRIPSRLVELLRGQCSAVALRQLGGQVPAGRIVIDRQTFRSFFDPSMAMIDEKIREQFGIIESGIRIDFVILVGGLGSSPVTQSHVKGLFGPQGALHGRCTNVLTASDPCLAVLSGAVLHGLFPSVILSRRSPVTFGFAFSEPYSARDPRHRNLPTVVEGGRRYVIFARSFLPKGELVLGEFEHRAKWQIGREGQAQLDFRLYTTPERVEKGRNWAVRDGNEECQVVFPLPTPRNRGEEFEVRLVFAEELRLFVTIPGLPANTRVPGFLGAWQRRRN